MKFTITIVLSIALALSLLFGSCGSNTDAPDVSNIELSVQSHDFYKDFFKVDTNKIEGSLQALDKLYPDFLRFYLDQLVGLQTNGSLSDTVQGLRFFLTYKDFRELFDTVAKVYPSTKDIDKQLVKVFKRIKHYDTTFTIPTEIYYYAAGLNLAVFTREHTMGIGLDMFLGQDFKPYQQIGIPSFRLLRHTPENIPIAAARAIYQDKYPFIVEEKNLLALMIEQGKEAYFTKKVVPEAGEALILGITEEQLKWCQENESMIYNFFVQQNLLYETNQQKVVRYVIEGPSSAGMPAESPGNTGSFTGLRIVENYAKNTGSSLAEVIKEQDYQKILAAAKYKP
jgi:hypothetical protein